MIDEIFGCPFVGMVSDPHVNDGKPLPAYELPEETVDDWNQQDLEDLLIAKAWNCTLGILNDSGGDYVAAKCEVSRLVHRAPIEQRLKKRIWKMLRVTLYYQGARNHRVPLRQLKAGEVHD